MTEADSSLDSVEVSEREMMKHEYLIPVLVNPPSLFRQELPIIFLSNSYSFYFGIIELFNTFYKISHKIIFYKNVMNAHNTYNFFIHKNFCYY